jgi:hypothetical protein
MLILKHLKTLQHVSIIIQIIFREFVGSLLKSLNLKYLTTRNVTHLHQTLCCHITTFNSWQLNFKFCDFNKEPTNSLMMIETCLSVFKCFNINILGSYCCIYMSISWYMRFSELKCTLKQ